MFITKKALPRRTFLRGAGATLALPLLDAMMPALTAAGKPTPRLGFIYVSNGVIQDQWIPAVTGANFELPAILKPLAPVRDHVNVLSGLSHLQADTFGDGTGDHPRSSAVWLTRRSCVRSDQARRRSAARDNGRSDRRARNRQRHPGGVARAVRRFSDAGRLRLGRLLLRQHRLLAQRDDAEPRRNASANRVRAAVRRRRKRGGSHRPDEGHRKHSRFGRRRSELPRQDARPRRPHQADRIPGVGPRDRAAHPEHRVERHAVDRAARASDRYPAVVRRAHEADARSGGPGLARRHHPRLLDDVLPRAQLADVPEHRRDRRAPRRLTSPQRS